MNNCFDNVTNEVYLKDTPVQLNVNQQSQLINLNLSD